VPFQKRLLQVNRNLSEETLKEPFKPAKSSVKYQDWTCAVSLEVAVYVCTHCNIYLYIYAYLRAYTVYMSIDMYIHTYVHY